ncbi:hypothetical protein [Haladaptatus litoreus]|uniref:hypothetical protein n=1 Tax=Haladaptatus litoreus TaxID=553468 RepID=UPI001C37812A|nr:hypothetical protein [Haladaptatus litoreus]
MKILLNGQRVFPDELGDNPAAETPVEFLDCNTARVIGEFEGIELNASFWDEAGIGTEILFPDPISGVTIFHPVEQFEPYPFTIESLRLDPNPIPVPGAPALYSADNPYAGPWCEREAFQFPNQLVITGGTPEDVISYKFEVSGSVKKSADADDLPIQGREVTVDKSDRITGKRVCGSVSGEVDVYRFSGEITDFCVDGSATIFLNGRRVCPREIGKPTKDRKRSIEYLDCDRAIVQGNFEQISIDTVWFARDGFATSFNVIGPVRGRTIIDRSNAGDIDDISGFVITRLSGFDEEFGEPVITVANPNLEECFQQIIPDPVQPFFEHCGPTDGGSNVTFAYDNPNNTELIVQSEFVGNATSEPPQTLEPGRNTFTVKWEPTTPDERLTWRLNLEPFAIDAQPTATSPPAADCATPTLNLRIDGCKLTNPTNRTVFVAFNFGGSNEGELTLQPGESFDFTNAGPVIELGPASTESNFGAAVGERVLIDGKKVFTVTDKQCLIA